MGLACMDVGGFLGAAGGAGMDGDRPLVFRSPCLGQLGQLGH
jgi:hypothetical protein